MYKVVVLLAVLNTARAGLLLPGDVVPLSYNLSLTTHIINFDQSDPESFRYEGTVDIALKAVSEVKDIVLHSNDTTDITSATLRHSGGTVEDLGTGDFDSETKQLSFRLEQGLKEQQEAVLSINFTAVHRGDHYRTGFAVAYEEDSPTTTWLLVLRAEFEFARHAFPCFDESKYKAIFRVSVTVDRQLVDNRHYTALSGTPVQSITNSSETVTFHFAETPVPIPTYMLGLLVGDFKLQADPVTFHSSYPGQGDVEKQLRFWSEADLALTEFDADKIQQRVLGVIEVLTDLFGVGLVSDNFDIVLVPDYIGMTPNLGAAVIGDDFLFYQEDWTFMGYVTDVLVKQWLGVLVTPHWWSDLWLSHGFATYLKYNALNKVVDREIQEWDLPYRFYYEVQQRVAFFNDQDDLLYPIIHPINKTVYSKWSDPIMNEKAGSVIKMIESVLGEDAFYKALQIYIKDNAEGFGTPESLLAALDSVAGDSASDLGGKTPSSLFMSWLTQNGFPVVYVNQTNEDPPVYVLSQLTLYKRMIHITNQTRLTQNKKRCWWFPEDESPDDERYNIPISWATNRDLNFNSTTAVSFFLQEDQSITVNLTKDVSWIIFNNLVAGHFRVNYDKETWDRLIVIVDVNPNIPRITREQIYDDRRSKAAAAESELTYKEVMELSQHLAKEHHYLPWTAAFRAFRHLQHMLAHNNTVSALLTKHILHLLEPHLHHLTRQDDLRTLVTSWTCRLGHPQCLTLARDYYLHMHTSHVNNDLKTALLCSVIRQGTQQEWQHLWNLLLSARPRDKRPYLQALGCSTNTTLINKLLLATLHDRAINSLQRVDTFMAVLEQDNRAAFAFLLTHFQAIVHKYRCRGAVVDILLATARTLSQSTDLAMLEQLNRHPAVAESAALQRSLRAALLAVSGNIQWQQNKAGQLHHWLINNYQ